ncbi:hypothetical protein BT96DRAFT_890282 [Gymnopus androsaceus JB14]|uniref:Galactose-binding like protein n=1 Tax=Gymnopus androsaceus JB14 TaxID=1447944 RepID=A0A6A4GT27_9AGAR|nr:hypothetical protein BT96DRAFT_890282 [Gymnopus androsaceus JB14]
MTSLVSLITPDTTIKVSSTLDKSVGKKNLVDGSPETCWTSQQGLPQTITLSFGSSSVPKSLSLTFQGGFVGQTCAVHVRLANPVESESSTNQWTFLTYIYPEDVNRKQTFTLPRLPSSSALPLSDKPTSEFIPSVEADSTGSGPDVGVTALKLTFESSSDFFGRVTVYDLRLEGYVL